MRFDGPKQDQGSDGDVDQVRWAAMVALAGEAFQQVHCRASDEQPGVGQTAVVGGTVNRDVR